MALVKLELDHEGFEQILTSDLMAHHVGAFTEELADAVRGEFPQVPVVVDRYDFHATGRASDRVAFSVTFLRSDGMGWQARNGLLTRLAAGLGAEVKERPR